MSLHPAVCACIQFGLIMFVRALTLPWIDGFKINKYLLPFMRRSVARKNHIYTSFRSGCQTNWSKVKIMFVRETPRVFILQARQC